MRHWKDAKTVADLGQLMADWLEGRIPKRPGYFGSDTDSETSELLPVLVAANRAGFVTDCSQPGSDGPAFDGRRWVQRAAVSGMVADAALYDRLVRGARGVGLLVPTSPVVVTTWAGQTHTSFGGSISSRELACMWNGISRQAMGEVKRARRLDIVDPIWGRSDRPWRLLDQIAGRR